ncbi:DUF5610 domain-containing protein [bacterium]|nr:DUF5610 domain-containing protein [bacterium]
MANPIGSIGNQPKIVLPDQLSKELKSLGFESSNKEGLDVGFPDLLKGMGLDGLDLSSEATGVLQYSRVQFEINYQSVKNINSANGIETEQIGFSLRGSFEFLQQISGGKPIDFKGARKQQDVSAEAKKYAKIQNLDGSNEPNILSKLNDFFSPEKTADRILDFALHFFPGSSFGKAGNTEENRKQFADFIGNAIQTGFDQAFQILGEIPKDVKSSANETHELVFKGLEDFVKNGISDEKAKKGGLFEKIEAFRIEMNFSAEVFISRKESEEKAYLTDGKTPKKMEIPGKKIDVQS